jgi:hypothetical protein
VAAGIYSEDWAFEPAAIPSINKHHIKLLTKTFADQEREFIRFFYSFIDAKVLIFSELPNRGLFRPSEQKYIIRVYLLI